MAGVPDLMVLTRRKSLKLLLASAITVAGMRKINYAQGLSGDELIIRPGSSFRPINVAIMPFASESTSSAKISEIITNNFKRSVLLQPLEKEKFAQTSIGVEQMPRAELWKALNIQFVVTGSVTMRSGRPAAAFRLWDIISGQQVAGQEFTLPSPDQNVQRLAHIISDSVFMKITGWGGCFDTQVVFVEETGPKEQRRKRLALMDQDGSNLRYLTGAENLVVTPRFSPTSRQVTYMSYGTDGPRVAILDLATGQQEVLGKFPGMTFSPRFSPDGQKIIMSSEEGASSNLFLMDLKTRQLTRLTDSASIDTSPSYSPDGNRITFESDRGGTQQIYIMSAQGGSAQRISFGSGRYSTPVWSPKGEYIAFTKQDKGIFSIGILKPDGSEERSLAQGYHNEGPTWAPNGLFVMFFRDPGPGSKIYMTDIYGRAEFLVPTPAYASDPSWSALLS